MSLAVELRALLLAPAFWHRNDEGDVITGFRNVDSKQAHLGFESPICRCRRPLMPAISLCHAGLADRRDIVNIHAGTTRPRRAIWITVKTMARSINWRRSSRLSPFPLSISEWQVTQIAAVAQSSVFMPIPLPSLRCATCTPHAPQRTHCSIWPTAASHFLLRYVLLMVTTLNLYQREVSAKHSSCVDVHLVGILQGLARRGVAEDKQIGTVYRRGNAVLSVANPFTIPDDHIFRDRLIEFIFVVRVVSVADNDFTFSGNQLDDEWQLSCFVNQHLSQHFFVIVEIEEPAATICQPVIDVSILRQAINHHLLMVTANRPEPRHSNHLQALDVFRAAVNKVTNRDQQITSRVERNLFELIHQQRVAPMQIADDEDIAPVSAINALIHAHADFLLAARRSHF
nr:MAG TPA_asm: hypothetical protein [Caudoviricetes sp.]